MGAVAITLYFETIPARGRTKPRAKLNWSSCHLEYGERDAMKMKHWVLNIGILATLALLIDPFELAYSENKDDSIYPNSLNAAEDSAHSGHDSDSPQFRMAHWGMRLSEVKQTEKSQLVEESDSLLVYLGYLGRMKCHIAYLFTAGELTEGKYYRFEGHDVGDALIEDYLRTLNILRKQLGEPQQELETWHSELYKEDYSKRTQAILIGDLSLSANWKTISSEVSLTLSAEDKKPHLEVIFRKTTTND